MDAFFLTEAKQKRSQGSPCVMLDIGGNVGDYSIALRQFSKKHGLPSCEVFAFEPVPMTFEKLKLSAQKNNFRAYNLGVSNKEGSFNITFREFGDEGATFKKSAATSLSKHTDAVMQKSVRVTTVDAQLRSAFAHSKTLEKVPLQKVYVPVLKIDVESLESKVFDGMQETLKAGQVQVIQWERHYIYKLQTTLAREVSRVASFGYVVYIVGTAKSSQSPITAQRTTRGSTDMNRLVLLRLDGKYFAQSIADVQCRVGVTINLIAVRTGHPFNAWAEQNALICRASQGNCDCDIYQEVDCTRARREGIGADGKPYNVRYPQFNRKWTKCLGESSSSNFLDDARPPPTDPLGETLGDASLAALGLSDRLARPGN
eukprot:5427474-Pyramimonas_sp.AAC.1